MDTRATRRTRRSTGPVPLRIAAVMMVRNEAAIIVDCIGHLLSGVAVDAVYVADNGSSDGTAALLARFAAMDGRVRVRSVPGAFEQPDTLAGLVRQAHDDGFAWVLPNDADEFLWLDAARLRAICAAAAPGCGGMTLRVHNFVQWRGVRRDRPGSIGTMLFRAVPRGVVADAQRLVSEEGLPFVRSAYSPKLLLRTIPGLRLLRGQHEATGTAGPLAMAPVADLLHAPIRARDDLRWRVDHGRRLAEIVSHPGVGWHLRRLVGMTEAELAGEWQANSAGWWPVGRGLRPDLRLARIGRRLRPLRVHMGVQPAAGHRDLPP